MKKINLTLLVMMLSISAMKAQDITYGATTGYNSLTVRASFQGLSGSTSESGIYFGLFVDVPISDKIHVQPEIQYSTIFANGGSGNELIVPIMMKYYLNDKLFLQAGPQFDLILDESPGIKKLGFGFGAGAGYDITEKLFASARFSFGLNNRLDDDTTILDEFGGVAFSDITSKFNFFQVGIGYKF